MKKFLLCILILFPLTVTSPRQGDLISFYKYIIKEASYLVRVINSETLGQSYEEKLRAGSVVLNRVRHPEFPNTIEDVVCEKDQFSGIDSKYFIVDNLTEKGRESIRAAHFLLKYGSVLPADVIFFHNPKVATNKREIERLKGKLYIKGDGHWYFTQ